MPDRKTHFPTPWLRIALALLAWALTLPSRSMASEPLSTGPCCQRTDFAVPPGPPAASLGAAVAAEDLPQVNALFPEGEEQDQVGAPAEDLLPYLVPCSFRPVADRRPAAPHATPSPYPLRC